MKKKLAEELLRIEAVFLRPDEPFIWSSGIASPIYCDNRLTLSYPEIRKMIAEEMANKIMEKYPEAELIAGTATAGIPHAAWVSDLLNLPMCYVRGKAKEHGKGNQIEGKVATGQKTVVIEDLISTGGSSIKAAEALMNAGAEVLGVIAIFSYELEKSIQMFREAKLEEAVLTDYTTLIETAKEQGYINAEELEKLKKWRENPETLAWQENG
ncbi:orotate phosphoribosyltransferase [Metabacillus sp. RGM 3146]|uniref:orotate phosphoribosyltransferase n=1 Tax=Metabacillus sp. RGM 3146 TaxID=3401092 RepID=UPI003B9C2BBD